MKYSKSTAKKIMAIGIVVGIVSGIINTVSEQINDYELERPGYSEQAAMYEIEADNGEETYDVCIEVPAKEYTSAEVIEHFNYVKEILDENIKGNNESLNNVKENLKLVSYVDKEGISIEWYSSDYSLVDYDGTVNNKDILKGEYKECRLYATLKYQEYQQEITYDITVTAPERTSKEENMAAFERQVRLEMNNNTDDEMAYLPEYVDGKKISYSKKEDSNYSIIFPALAFIFVITLFLKDVLEKRKNEEYRIEQLKKDYSEVVLKMTLLVGAGMAFRKAWEKIVAGYKKTRKNEKRFVYEEMENAMHQMETGISEAVVYEQFGKNCNTKEYLKLASLLQQHLKKGTKELAELLRQEADDAFEQRKNNALKKGEKASTKLLLPMTMMLLVVMIIVMVPALMSFKI